jgi:hypothetical protein
MNTTGAPPAWAIKLVTAEGRRHRKRLPLLKWRAVTRDYGTAGSWDEEGYALSMTVGYNLMAQRHKLCHEMAHWITNLNHKDVGFWLKAFELFRRYRVPMGYVLRWESAYRQAALDGYWAGRDKRGRRPTAKVKVTTSIDAGPRV